jgi:hypothetical protein
MRTLVHAWSATDRAHGHPAAFSGTSQDRARQAFAHVSSGSC